VLASAKIGGKDVVAVKKKGRRELIYDHIIHSRLYDDSIYTKQYWDYLLPLAAVFEKPKILVIGLGGGTIPFQIMKKFGNRATIDVVEIDREMVRLSKAFLPEKLEANIVIGDGYAYLSDKKAVYNVIIADPYISGEIPDEFFQNNFIENANNALKENGILGINYALTIRALSRRSDLVRKLRKAFSVYTINYPRSSGNAILVCSKKYKIDKINDRITDNFPKDGENGFLFKAYSKAR
jgi:spermidine synthase